MIRKANNGASRSSTRRLVKRVVTSVALVGGLLSSSVALASADSNAVRVVQSYMKSLFIGDVGAMEQVLGANLQQERARTLGNASYPRTLQSAYAGASYTVVESDQLSAHRANVMVRIKLSSTDVIHVSFLLDGKSGTYRIISET